METRGIAIFGKGGIGKSTIASNLSAAISLEGKSVIQVGCDPKHDSTSMLNGGKLLPTILDAAREKKPVEEVIFRGYNGVLCAEAGGPEPGVGCAGRGVMVALQLLSKEGIYEKYGIDFAIYDVLGDIVCGGFAQPMRMGYTGEVYIVSSGELMALYAANNIARGVKNVSSERKDVMVYGLIDNMKGIPGEKEITEEFAERIGIPLIEHIPRSEYVQKAESMGKTVIEAFPHSELARIYRRLAKEIMKNEEGFIPKPVELEEIMDILKAHGLGRG
ncbi:MAG: nucleotide-binding protein [Candidatus Syntropharchaeia archaeon]